MRENKLVFNVIAAASENMGIGIKGNIPWRLKNEMAYFTRLTSTTRNVNKQNAVVMGRKTWECIPKKYKPLPNRLNIVLSNTITKTTFKDVPVCKTLNEALSLLSQGPYSDKIENIWIIGGSRVYDEAVNSVQCDKIYLTRVKGNFECDTFFPTIPPFYKEIKEEGVPTEVQEENGLSYVYTVLKRESQ